MGHEINFNGRVLDALKPAEKFTRIEYRDKKESGLYIYVTAKGKKTFYLYKYFQGRPLRVKLGCYPDLSVSAAREKARKLKGKMAGGEDPRLENIQRVAGRVTLRKISEEYLETKRGKISIATVRLYESINRSGLAPMMDLPIAQISKKRLVALHKAISARGSKKGADSIVRAFGMYFNFFVDRYEFAGVNPVKTISQNKLWNGSMNDRRTTYIKDEDLPKWFKAVLAHHDATERDYLLTLVFSGMRKSECASMRWADVDMKKKIFTVHETKNGKPHTLPMSDFLHELLQYRAKTANSSFVFHDGKNPAKPFNSNTTASRLSELSGVNFTLHDLRRTFSTMADRAGLTHYTIKALLNHKSSADVTQGYIMREVEQLREPMEKVAGRVLEVVD